MKRPFFIGRGRRRAAGVGGAYVPTFVVGMVAPLHIQGNADRPQNDTSDALAWSGRNHSRDTLSRRSFRTSFFVLTCFGDGWAVSSIGRATDS